MWYRLDFVSNPYPNPDSVDVYYSKKFYSVIDSLTFSCGTSVWKHICDTIYYCGNKCKNIRLVNLSAMEWSSPPPNKFSINMDNLSLKLLPTMPLSASIQADTNQIFLGDTITLSAITFDTICPLTYLWDPGHYTTQTITVIPESTTTYYVTVSSCYNSVVDSINIIMFPNYTGWVRYKDNESSSPLYTLNNTVVNLDQGGIPWYEGWTNSQGDFSIACLSGTYDVILDIQNSYYPGNSIDGLLAAKFAVGSISLTSFQQHLADVNGSSSIDATDALLIMRRFVGLSNSFPNNVEDWYSESYGTTINPIIITSGEAYVGEFSAACMGDVSLSNYFHYAFPKIRPSVVLSTSGIKYIKSGKAFDIDVVINDSMVVGAMSLEFYIPPDIYKLNDVQIPGTCDTCKIIVYNDHTGDLKIAWYNVTGLLRDTNDLLVKLNLTALNESYSGSLEGIEINDISEIADTSGRSRTNIELLVPKIFMINNYNDNFELKIFPIPTMDNIEVSYTIPKDGKVNLEIFDMLGREVTQLINSQQYANSYYENFDVSKIINGVYTYRFRFDDIVKTGKIVINR